jgi:hypothetical protein
MCREAARLLDAAMRRHAAMVPDEWCRHGTGQRRTAQGSMRLAAWLETRGGSAMPVWAAALMAPTVGTDSDGLGRLERACDTVITVVDDGEQTDGEGEWAYACLATEPAAMRARSGGAACFGACSATDEGASSAGCMPRSAYSSDTARHAVAL